MESPSLLRPDYWLNTDYRQMKAARRVTPARVQLRGIYFAAADNLAVAEAISADSFSST